MSARHVNLKCQEVLAWASTGSWPFALSEVGAKPNTGKDLETKLLDTSATLSIDTSVDVLRIIKSSHSRFGDNSRFVRLSGDQGPAVVLSISDTRYSRIVKRSRLLEKNSSQIDYSKIEVSVKLYTALMLLGNLE